VACFKLCVKETWINSNSPGSTVGCWCISVMAAGRKKVDLPCVGIGRDLRQSYDGPARGSSASASKAGP
jgi:hypothetical protein